MLRKGDVNAAGTRQAGTVTLPPWHHTWRPGQVAANDGDERAQVTAVMLPSHVHAERVAQYGRLALARRYVTTTSVVALRECAASQYAACHPTE